MSQWIGVWASENMDGFASDVCFCFVLSRLMRLIVLFCLGMFRSRAVYYMAIVADLVLRFLWTLTLVPLKNVKWGESEEDAFIYVFN
jgi:hypothetical protein